MVLGLVVLCSALQPAVREEACWIRATSGAGLEDYSRFIGAWPNGRHAAEAKRRHEVALWADAVRAQTEETFLRYLRRTHLGLHSAEVDDRIETLHWEAAVKGGTVRHLQDFFALHPDGRFAGEADRRITLLLLAEEPFKNAIASSAVEDLERFLVDFPGHVRSAEVRAALAEIEKDAQGRHVVDLIAEGKLEAEPSGEGMGTVSLRCRSLVNHPVRVLVPAGTYFRSRQGGAQNMMCTAESDMVLDGAEEETMRITAACCNMHRDTPDETNGFEIRKTCSNPELRRLIDGVRSAGVEDQEIIQAAVWIVTDNARYEDLREERTEDDILELDLDDAESTRAGEAVRAIRLCAQSGIEVRSRAIWADRGLLRRTVRDSHLRRWLEQIEAAISRKGQLSL